MAQVAWQSLLDESSDGSVIDDSGAGKASIAAAVLTSHRLCIVSATMLPLCALAPRPPEPAIISFLWLGPALLFCNSAHQVPVRLFAVHMCTLIPYGICSWSAAWHGAAIGQHESDRMARGWCR
jgi:hypothetical protein